MNAYKFKMATLLIIIVGVLISGGCTNNQPAGQDGGASDADADSDGDADADGDGDSDADGDGDSDTDSDVDGDSDADGDTDSDADSDADTSSDTETHRDTDTTAESDTGEGLTAPDLVTSGPDDYWNTEGTVTELASGTADLTVDENTTHQRWDGFGGTFNEAGWDALSVVSSEITYALTLLFGEDHANFVYGRIPMGASDYSMSQYTYAETPNDYEMNDFSIARDHEMMIPYIKASLEIKPDLILWGSPWYVPDWMTNGGTMKGDAQTLEAHALYLARFVEEYAAEEMTIEAIHPQNEPGYGAIRWEQSVLIDYFKTYLGPKFDERGLTTEIWCGTISHPDNASIATAVANDPESMEIVTGFGLQWNHVDTVALLAPMGPVMQTEHRCGNYNFEAPYWDQSRYDPNMPQNDHLYGEESWQLIRDWIVGGVNSYLAWNMVLDTQGVNSSGWHQNALLVVDRSAERLIETPAYYVFRHYSQYIAPGATRIGITGTNDALAFINPNGIIVTQIYNGGDSSRTMTVDVSQTLYQFDVPAHGWATLRVAESTESK